MIGIVNASKGGISTSTVGYINVSFPSGSTCTAIKGTTTLTAPYTTGMAVFEIPSTGSWTVSCTNGTKSDTKTVTVNSGSVVTVKLTYGLLYNADGMALWTPGRKRRGDGDSLYIICGVSQTVTSDNYMQASIYSGSWPTGTVYWGDPIDLSSYNSIKIDYYWNGVWYINWSLWSTAPQDGTIWTTNVLRTTDWLQNTSGNLSAVLDINGLTGNGYLGCMLSTGSSSNNMIYVKKVECLV